MWESRRFGHVLGMAELEEAVIAEVEMSATTSGTRTVRATVVQASTVFYDTPATLGMYPILHCVAGIPHTISYTSP